MKIMLNLSSTDIKKAIEEYVERKMPLPHDVTGVNLDWPYAMLCDNGVYNVTLEMIS